MSAISFIECETLSELQQLQQKCGWVLGCMFTAIGYGIGTALFIISYTRLRKRAAQRQSRRTQHNVLLAYITFLWMLNCVATALAIYATIGALERTCPVPGQIPVNPYYGKANVVYFLLSWCSDALLVWRCKVIFSGSHHSPWFYLGVPITLITVSFGIGIPTVVLSSISRTKTVTLFLVIYSIASLCAGLGLGWVDESPCERSEQWRLDVLWESWSENTNRLGI